MGIIAWAIAVIIDMIIVIVIIVTQQIIEKRMDEIENSDTE